MKLTKVLAVALFFGMLCVSLPSLAQDKAQDNKQPFPIAVIAIRDVLVKSDQGIQIAKDLEAKFGDRKKQLQKDEQELAQLKKEADAPNAPAAKIKAFTAKRDKFVAETRKYQMEEQQAEQAAVKLEGDRLLGIVQDYMKEKGLKGIQDRTGFIAVDPSLDITNEIIQRMNQK